LLVARRHRLGNSYLEEKRRSRTPPPKREKPVANAVLHHLRKWSPEAPSNAAALHHLHGQHSKSLDSFNVHAPPIFKFGPAAPTTNRRPSCSSSFSSSSSLPADSETGEGIRASIDNAFDVHPPPMPPCLFLGALAADPLVRAAPRAPGGVELDMVQLNFC